MSGFNRALPNGQPAKNLDEYLAAWDALAAKALTFFPGYEESGRNPGISFVKYGVNGLGQRVVIDRLNLTVASIEALMAPQKSDACDSCN